MGKRANRLQEIRSLGFDQPSARKINARRVRKLRDQIETDLVNAVREGYLTEEGVFLAYRNEHLPELPEAVRLYQHDNPHDQVEYLGLDPDDGRYTVRILPDLQWLFSIRQSIPNLTFERIRAIGTSVSN